MQGPRGTRFVGTVRGRLPTVVLMSIVLLLILGIRGSGPVRAETSVRLTAAGDYASTSQAAATMTTISQLNPDAHLALGDC
jgi:hypothetical protein